MGTRIMVSHLLTVCACVFTILEAKPQYGDWWANNRGPSQEYGHYGSFLGMGRPQNPQFGARPTPQLPQYGNYGSQLPQFGNYGPQLPQYGNYGGLWGGNKAARPPRWWGQG